MGNAYLHKLRNSLQHLGDLSPSDLHNHSSNSHLHNFLHRRVPIHHSDPTLYLPDNWI